jgi:dTDP-glucose 4,6-dehydratase
VTGGAGFLGSHLCDRLLGDGYDVIALDNLLTGAAANVQHLLPHPQFRMVTCDVTHHIDIADPVDYVLHFASPASPIDYLRLPIETMKVGSVGTLHALGLAKDKRARFVLASTSEAYGDPQVHPQPEHYWGHVNPVGPRGVYDEAKRFAEALTVAYRSTHGVDTAIIRIFNTYGPRMRVDDGRAIPTFLRQALTGQSLTVAGDGSQTRSVCFVDDTVRGVLAVAVSDLAGPVNVGSPDEMSILRIAEEIIAATGSPSAIRFIELPVDDPLVRRPDTTLIERELGWRPRVSWDEGIRRTIAALVGQALHAGIR